MYQSEYLAFVKISVIVKYVLPTGHGMKIAISGSYMQTVNYSHTYIKTQTYRLPIMEIMKMRSTKNGYNLISCLFYPPAMLNVPRRR